MLLPGQTNVGARYYGNDYKLFSEVDQSKVFFAPKGPSADALRNPKSQIANPKW